MNVIRGDILVQCDGEPWTTGCELITGHPFPHAMLITGEDGDFVNFIENGKTNSNAAMIRDGKLHKSLINNGYYEIWRPKCDDKTKDLAIKWCEKRIGTQYGYFRMLTIASTYRLGFSDWEGINDDDFSQDDRGMVCSEMIAMAFYRSGYDVAPGVSNRQTMPWDLRNSQSSYIKYEEV